MELKNGQHHTQPLLVLFGGATCGGKSTVADRIQKLFPNCNRISQDDYFGEEEDPKHFWITLSDGFKHQDWENMNSVDWTKMQMAVNDQIQKLSQDYNVELRNCKPFLLIEGHLVLAHDWTEVCDRQLRFFFTIDQKSCLERRHARTYIPPDPPTFFTDRVWPAYLQHEQEIRVQSNPQQVHFVDGTSDLEQLCVSIEKLIEKNL